jgi:hypothetical protein
VELRDLPISSLGVIELAGLVGLRVIVMIEIGRLCRVSSFTVVGFEGCLGSLRVIGFRGLIELVGLVGFGGLVGLVGLVGPTLSFLSAFLGSSSRCSLSRMYLGCDDARRCPGTVFYCELTHNPHANIDA